MMRYLRYTHVDAVSGLPASEAPMSAGPVPPAVKGLTFGFALESQYPTERPTFYGTSDDDADLGLPGVMGEASQADYEAAEAREMAARPGSLTNRTNADVLAAPAFGFGGPSGKELFNGNR